VLTAPRRLLLVHAHPDDESLWTGGTIARYAAAGVHVTLVTCTLGEQGEVIPPELRGLAADAADQLGGYRVGELRAACATLGVDDQCFLGGLGRWRDSGMVVEPGGRASAPAELHPRAFAAGDLDEQAAQLVEVLREVDPQVVISYGPDGGYGHPDHVRAHQVTMAAGKVLARSAPEVFRAARVFWTVLPRGALDAGITALSGMPGLPFPPPAPGGLPGVPDEEVSVTIDVREHRQSKIAAMSAHYTQLRVWQGRDGQAAFALSDGVAQPLLDAEYYTLAAGPPVGLGTDLFADLGGDRGP
jgi:N-acetyl-1-D-myo-inositol-2-amino-2-deoxy-alpha-D-glucopyranoside deacetylase